MYVCMIVKKGVPFFYENSRWPILYDIHVAAVQVTNIANIVCKRTALSARVYAYGPSFILNESVQTLGLTHSAQAPRIRPPI